MKPFVPFSLFLFFCTSLWSQPPAPQKKQLQAIRISTPIDIDGTLSEDAWQTALPATDFTTLEPNPGLPASQRTEVRVLYDNTGIYVGAFCHDTDPAGIKKELSERDETRNTDWFGLFFDPYLSGINALGFLVTPTGVQGDFKFTQNGDDGTWDAVWESAARITEDGWIAEIKIPFSALRFPEEEVQTWHVNFARDLRRSQELSFWNPIDPAVAGMVNQSGILTGITGIRAPFRLQATPFMVTYGQQYSNRNAPSENAFGQSFNGGMDIKYGINDAFTLDMTLVPDFGEVQSDNQVLNLSPFEVRFDENRQFFTEGAEIFNKGGLFYSRRIGGRPLNYGAASQQLQAGEKIVENPLQSQLINATKVSGRYANGLGLGFFNATAARMNARIERPDGSIREVETNPLTNYNVFVLDQNLKNNSYVTFINTTVLRDGSAYDANVTGTLFDIRNKSNQYQVSGGAILSQKYHPGQTGLGHSYNLTAGKIGGRLNFSTTYNVESDTYDPTDLGFLLSNNERSVQLQGNYQFFKPFWKFNRANIGMNYEYVRLYNPDVFTQFSNNLWAWGQFKNFWNIEMWYYGEPVGSYDYFEPRTPGRYLRTPEVNGSGFDLSTDARKRLQLSVEGRYIDINEPGRRNVVFGVAPRFRVNDRLNFRWQFNRTDRYKNVGFVNKVTDYEPDPNGGSPREVTQIIMGYRNLQTLENILNINYTFNARMTLSLRTRHNWSKVHYLQFNSLQNDGSLAATDYDTNHDANFNAFNVDMVYRWRFAPGSDLFFIWKNAILGVADEVAANYSDNLSTLFGNAQQNTFSLKVIYFLDYARMMKRS
ncbi:MAG: DUF5916 domain-containing protein [Haliscomenobacter sp.]